MTETLNLTTAAPAEIDAAWFPLMAASNRALDNALRTHQSKWSTEESKGRADAELAACQAAEEPFLAEWERRGRWTRAFLVDNTNGHVHSSTACGTCFITTRFVVLAELSGADHDTIVQAAGSDACTVCYPGAPVAPRTVFTATEKLDQAEKAQRAAELAAKRAAKAAKAITAPDGSPLRDDWKHVLATETAARQRAVTLLADVDLYGYAMTQDKIDAVDRIVASIAAKHGQTQDEVRTMIESKVAAKVKRERR